MKKAVSATLVACAIVSAPSALHAQAETQATPQVQAATPSEGRLCESVVGSSAAASQARAPARSMITAKSGSPYAAFLNGCLAFGDGRPDKAADFFAIAASNDPKSLYFDWLGRAYGDQAQKASKIKQPFLARKTKNAFEKAVALDPNNLDARSYLAQFYQLAPSVMGGSEAKARAEIQAIRSRNAYRGRIAGAGYASRAGDLDAAAREYDALARAFPDSAAGWNGLMNTHIARKQWNEAFRAAEALRARPAHASLGDYAIGRIAALSGEQLAEGEAALRRYLTTTPSASQPSIANAHFRLAQILEARKDVAAARTEYEQTLKLQPGHNDAKKALASLK